MNRKPLEKSVQAECIKRLEKRGAYVYRAIANAMAAKGTPDTLCCIGGRFVAIEFKREHNGDYGITKPQRFRMRQVEQAGGMAFCVADADEVDFIVENMSTVVACEDCKRPVRSLAHTSLNGFCTECAQKRGDILGAHISSAVMAAEQMGLTGTDVRDFVEESTGEKITYDDYMRLADFNAGTTLARPSLHVNGVDIEIGVDNG